MEARGRWFESNHPDHGGEVASTWTKREAVRGPRFDSGHLHQRGVDQRKVGVLIRLKSGFDSRPRHHHLGADMETWEYVVLVVVAVYAICMVAALRWVERDEEDERDV